MIDVKVVSISSVNHTVIIGKINNKFMVMAINDKNTCITDIKDNL